MLERMSEEEQTSVGNRTNQEITLHNLLPEWVEPRHLYVAVDNPAPLPKLVRWLLDVLPLSVVRNYRNPDTNLIPMEVLCQGILGQEEWQRYHKGIMTRLNASWECVRLLAVKEIGCCYETPVLHACLRLHLQDSSRMPFSLLQKALSRFSYQAQLVDPSGHLPLHIVLEAATQRRHRNRRIIQQDEEILHDDNNNNDDDDDDEEEEENDKEFFGLIQRVSQLYELAAEIPDPMGRLPMDVAIVSGCHKLAWRYARIYPAGLGIRARYPSALVFCTLLARAPIDLVYKIIQEVSNYMQ